MECYILKLLYLLITGFRFMAEIRIFLFATVSRPAASYALCCTVYIGNRLFLFPGVNLSVRIADYLPTSSADCE
jgi:hypothetical protein